MILFAVLLSIGTICTAAVPSSGSVEGMKHLYLQEITAYDNIYRPDVFFGMSLQQLRDITFCNLIRYSVTFYMDTHHHYLLSFNFAFCPDTDCIKKYAVKESVLILFRNYSNVCTNSLQLYCNRRGL